MILTASSMKSLASGAIELPSVPAGKTVSVELPINLSKFKQSSETWLKTIFRLKTSQPWADAGHEVSWFQHRLDNTPVPHSMPSLSSIPLTIKSSRTQHTISGDNFSFVFDSARGVLTQWLINSRPIFSPTPQGCSLVPSFWRPPTDNDMSYDVDEWRNYGLDTMTSQLRSFSIIQTNPEEVTVSTRTFISPPVLAWGWETEIRYRVSSAGPLSIDVHLVPIGPAPKYLPRVGLDLRLQKSFNSATWFGLGPGEAYPDKKNAQKIGIYDASIEQLHTSYEVPQENGNRMQTRWVKILDARGNGIKATSSLSLTSSEADKVAGTDGRLLNWQVSQYSPQAIENAKHPRDLVEDEFHWLRIDAEVAGVGTAACGPGVGEKYRVKCEEKRFGVVLDREHI